MRFNSAQASALERGPDEEGIETRLVKVEAKPALERGPDEEGIETS